MDQLPLGLSAGLEAWMDAVRDMAQAPDFYCVLPAADPDRGFDIGIERAGGRVTATFGGLIHDCEAGVDEALTWVQRAYTPGWRLRVDSVGGRPVTFTLENPAEPAAGCISSAYVTLFAGWRQRSTATYVNAPASAQELARALSDRQPGGGGQSTAPKAAAGG
ncbi:MAG: hypothetical protein NW223_15765 [Hyphomicrobiaceae bacterium]|nr:hypothetical protein [Hyphomicrobiaceae bacterium]